MPRRISKPIIILLVIIVLMAAALVGFNFGYQYVRDQDRRLDSLKQQFDEHGSAPFNKDTPLSLIHIWGGGRVKSQRKWLRII